MSVEASVRSVTKIDQHVSRQIRLRRKMLNISQDVLAEATGVTFQQIQKYENGTNRVSAGRLLSIAQVLRVPVTFFYEGFEVASPADGTAIEAGEQDAARIEKCLVTGLGVDMLRAFSLIKNEAHQRLLINLANGLADTA